MRNLVRFACSAAFMLASLNIVTAQRPTTTTTGTRDASITSSSTRGLQQQPRPTTTPVLPVRPLSQEDAQRQEASSARRRQEAASGEAVPQRDVS